jgi:hypothetical protein
MLNGTQKAAVAFALAFLTALLAQVADKTEFTDLTVLQWIIAVVSAVVTAGGVYVIPNKVPQSLTHHLSTSRPLTFGSNPGRLPQVILHPHHPMTILRTRTIRHEGTPRAFSSATTGPSRCASQET